MIRPQDMGGAGLKMHGAGAATPFLLLVVIQSISSNEVFEKLDPFPDDPIVLPRAAAESELTTFGSGSISGSGDLLLPTSTESIATPDYNTKSFISLTFINLSSQQHEPFEEQLRNMLIRLLELDSSPLIIIESSFMSTSIVLVYFPVERTNLEFYAKTLRSSNDTEWRNFSASYGLTATNVEMLTFPVPWWHWLITGLSLLAAASAYLLILITCCCRCHGLKKRNPNKVKEWKTQQVFPLQKGSKLQMQEQVRQQLVRKVSRVNFQSRSNMHFHSHPLSVVDLEHLVANPSPILSEYASVPSNMVTMAEVPAGAEEKNRYRDVLPNPQTRVALFLKFGVANSDYINANYIRGYKNSSKSYIATQGPLQWTVADFWRMVWEQKSSTIVMTTNLEEKGMVKCIQYWPEEKRSHSIVYEDLEINLRRRIITKNYSTTTLLLQHKDKMVSREVTHFWFTGWPDHGTPSAKAVLEFVLHVQKHTNLDMPGPIVVHCSAGIGRSGVFIAADIAIQQLDQEEEIDILQILSSLRQDRGGMVQTNEQYVFLHKVLLEYARFYGRKVNHDKLEPTIEEDEPIEDEIVEDTSLTATVALIL